MSRQRHYKNPGLGGDTVFITTKALDRAPLFSRPVVAFRLANTVFEVHQHCGAILYAFVIMPEHIHLISRLPATMPVTDFVRVLKSYSARQLRPLVSRIEARSLETQRGLNDRHFWARSFRSYIIERDAAWHQKLQYLHLNPVRRSLCQLPEDYRWSSARMFAAGMWNEESGLAWKDWKALEDGDDGLGEVPPKASTHEGVEALHLEERV